MRDIAVYGAGAYGEEVYLLIEKVNSYCSTEDQKWNFIGFFDDNYNLSSTENTYGNILGGIDALNNYQGPLSIVIGIASSTAIHAILGRITKLDVDFPNIIDPDTSFIDKNTFKIGVGNIIGEGCRFSPKVTLGDFNIIVNDSVFGHDAFVGSYNVFFPEVRLSGKTVVGDNNLFGMRTAVFQGVRIFDNVKLSAGSILSMNARSGFTYIGNPAKRLKI